MSRLTVPAALAVRDAVAAALRNSAVPLTAGQLGELVGAPGGRLYPHLHLLVADGRCERHPHPETPLWTWIEPGWTPGVRAEEIRVEFVFERLTAGMRAGGAP